MRIVTLTAFMITASTWPILGSADEISGFQSFSFGMDRKEVEANNTISLSSEDADGGNWYRTEQPVNVLGHDFTQELLFGPEDKLVQINLWRRFSGGDITCTGAFDSAFGAIQARYGAADQPPVRSEHGGISAITSAKFTSLNGAYINLSSIWLTECVLNVAYVTSRGGTGF